MKKVCSIIKWIVFFIVLILLVIGGGWEIPIPNEGLRNLIDILHDFMNDNSEKFFILVGMLLIIYWVPNAVEHFCNKAETKETVQTLETNQSRVISLLETKSDKIKTNINKNEELIKDTEKQTSEKIIITKSKIKIALTNIKSVYTKNQSTYHLNNKKIYKIVSKTNIRECEAIDKLLNEFNSLN